MFVWVADRCSVLTGDFVGSNSRSAALVQLFEPVNDDLSSVRRIIADELDGQIESVNQLCRYVLDMQGKMLRPALLLLVGRACGQLRDAHLTLAAVVEMIHLATLVHDDVLDEADVRRRRPTVHQVWGNATSVLLGDYLISHAFHLCSSLDSQLASRLIGQATNRICEGELMQLARRGRWDVDEQQYLTCVDRKTAVLCALCGELGSRWADADETTIYAMSEYGRCIGLAFQITDDLMDIVGNQHDAGKTLGTDLARGTITLPIIHCLAHARDSDGQRLRELLESGSGNGQLQEIRDIMEVTGSIEFTRMRAASFLDDARSNVRTLGDCEARQVLLDLADCLLDRRA